MKQERNFFYLLAAMLFYLLVSPVIDEFWPWPAFKPQGLIFALTLVLALFGNVGRRSYVVTVALLALAALLPSLLPAGPVQSAADFVAFGAFLTFLLVAIVVASRQIYRRRQVNANQLMGAVCVYLLLGVIWSMLYALLFTLDTAAFRGVEPVMTIEYARDWLYFSFVTLATLGYGDIVPVSTLARTLAYLEAIVGQFYIAILVAGLVGSYLSEQRR